MTADWYYVPEARELMVDVGSLRRDDPFDPLVLLAQLRASYNVPDCVEIDFDAEGNEWWIFIGVTQRTVD